MPRNGDTKGGRAQQRPAPGTLRAQSKDSVLKKLLVPLLGIQVTPGH